MRNRKSAIAVVGTLILFLGTMSVSAQSYLYHETTGEKELVTTWHREMRDGKMIITLDTGEETDIYHCLPDGNTLLWKRIRPQDDIDVTAERTGSTIRITGTMEGEPVDEQLEVDGLPWIQPMPFLLGSFALSEKDEVTFFVIRPGNLSLTKMQARKDGRVTLSLPAGTMEAQRVKITPAGLLAMFWNASLSYRVSDGLYLEYRGTNGPPGTPPTHVQFRETDS